MMNIKALTSPVQGWRRLSITRKFTVGFGVLLVLMILVALIGYLALTKVRRETESAIVTSTEVQRLVLAMDSGMQRARLQQRDFFLRWPTLGFTRARATFAAANSDQVATFVDLNTRLQTLITGANVSEELRKSSANLKFYLSSADYFLASFAKAIALVEQLASDEVIPATGKVGLQTQLAQKSVRLYELLQAAQDPALIMHHREMQSYEKEYLVTRQPPQMQQAFGVASNLQAAITAAPGFEPAGQREALVTLDEYLLVATEIIKIDVEIRSRLYEIDMQAEAVDPIGVDLIELANREVERARQQIADINRLAVVLLIGAVVAAVLLAILIARLLNSSITHNVIKLTTAAVSLRNGNLAARAPINSPDELGQLADSFNTMAAQLDNLIHNLEQKVAERTTELASANAEITALNAMLKEENLRMGAELEVARRLQQMILPKAHELSAVEHLDIAGYMESAAEVGGDYYDVLQHNGHIKIGIGDVTGHGLESGVLMLMAQMGVRTLLTHNETNPTSFLDVLNRMVYNNVQRMEIDKSLTLALLDYHPGTDGGGQVQVSGQHEELIVVRRGGAVERVDTLDLGLPIGLDDPIVAFINQLTIDLQVGDGAVLYTDGITEAENLAGEQYGLERLCQIVGQQWEQPAEGIKEAVIRDVRQFIGGQTVFDDITLVVVKQK
jgi:serine phosphatase RsbU (regulator of sigma subunit)